jgi:hypothetical protein
LNPRGESVENRGSDARRRECASTLKALSIAMNDENQNRPAPTLGPDVMSFIGRELRAMYADIVAEGLPERFAGIMRKLDHPGDERETP